MNQTIARRVRFLEQELAQLRSVCDRLTPQENRALTDAWLLALIRAGLVPAPDPTHPHASIESLRHTHRDALEALRQTVISPAWQRKHGATGMALFLRELQRIAAGRR